VKATGLNHVSVHADDLERSVAFYSDLFGMAELPTPQFGYPVRWLRLGRLQLHLFQRSTGAPEFHHFAVDVDDFEAAFLKARERGILDGGPRRFPDGTVQMYIRDPAGNRVEIDWPDSSTLDPAVFGELEQVPGDPRASLYAGRLEPLDVPELGPPISHYSHAVRAGATLYVSGLVSRVAGDVVAQASDIFQQLGLLLERAGAGPADVAKLTIFMRDVGQRPAINPLREQFFGRHRPASTLVEVSRLVRDDLLLEIEAYAALPG